ncbi:hypothetical protein [Salipiger bermudensis]|uniref:hypothetical protein n=1 Tax=Salipiger bermudensis TaxID=344736 RepID=UPI001A8F88DA|nr:hypothetical protein [Salipiger bermudensis]MBN9678849.1 hypothetical protein [Salipiger bermudensis]
MTIQNLAERVALCFEISESDDGRKLFRPDPDCPRFFVDAIQSMICAVIYDPDAVYEMAHHVASHMSNFEEIDQARETLCNIVPDQGDELSEWKDADPDRAEDVEKIQSDLDCDLIEASFIAWQNEAEKLFDELADYLAVRGEEMEREEV